MVDGQWDLGRKWTNGRNRSHAELFIIEISSEPENDDEPNEQESTDDQVVHNDGRSLVCLDKPSTTPGDKLPGIRILAESSGEMWVETDEYHQVRLDKQP